MPWLAYLFNDLSEKIFGYYLRFFPKSKAEYKPIIVTNTNWWSFFLKKKIVSIYMSTHSLKDCFTTNSSILAIFPSEMFSESSIW